jgi:hypothetical protein
MDNVFTAFLEHQHEEGMVLAARSPLLTLVPGRRTPPDRWVARFACRGLVRAPGGDVVEAEGFEAGIWFPGDYLRRVNPIEVVSWLAPREVFHPNIGEGPGGRVFVCVGHLAIGTPLVDILMQLFEIITYRKVTMCEDDALNREACMWARANQERFPTDRRSLVGHAIEVQRVDPEAGRDDAAGDASEAGTP